MLQRPTPDPSISDAERGLIAEMMAKGTYAGVDLATADVDVVFAEIEGAGAEIVQERLDQDYGLRDCAVRDPADNLIRIQQRPCPKQRPGRNNAFCRWKKRPTV